MQSSNLHFYRPPSGIRKTTATTSRSTDAPSVSPMSNPGSPTPVDPVVASSEDQLNVHGWLMSVPGYRKDDQSQGNKEIHGILAGDNGFSDNDTSHIRRARSTSRTSISSNESVNLDDLIKNNFTEQVHDEKDLPNLADLDLDDSADDFWKMLDTTAVARPMLPLSHGDENWKGTLSAEHIHDRLSIDKSFEENEFITMSANDELINWSPEVATHVVDEFITMGIATKQSVPSVLSATVASRYALGARDHRSGSVSSENSLTSQSTVTTGVHHYGMTPIIYPSESTASNSSRSPSRLSDYSAASSQTSTNTTGFSHRRPSSGTGSSGLPAPSGSQNTVRRSAGEKGSSEALRPTSRISSRAITSGQSRLAKRATHVPLPSARTPPTTVVATTSRSTGLSGMRRPSATGTIGIRASAAASAVSDGSSRPGSRIGGLRSSHIPAPRKAAASPEPPSSTTHAHSPTLSPTRYRPHSPLGARRMSGLRSPTPTAGSVNARSSVFGSPSTTKPTLAREESRIGRLGNGTTGLKPPATFASSNRPPRQK